MSQLAADTSWSLETRFDFPSASSDAENHSWQSQELGLAT
jgi:hypothetical protein